MTSKSSQSRDKAGGSGKPVPTSGGVAYTKEFGERLGKVIDSVGSLVKAGEIAGVTDEQVGRWRDGLSKPNFFGLGNLAVASGFSLDWILTGEGLPHATWRGLEAELKSLREQVAARAKDDSDEPANQRSPGMQRLLDQLAERLGMAEAEVGPPALSLPGDFRLIPRLDVQAAAGAGALVEHEQPREMVAFRADWLRRRGINPLAASVLTARGDSMEPTIRDGDILLVDTSIDRVVDNAIYVVVFDGRTLVKRVQLRRDGSVVLKSDNSAIFDDEAVPAAEVHGLNVAGRVMWYGRSI